MPAPIRPFSIQSRSPFQKPLSYRTTGKSSTFFVWTRVRELNSSSSVPKPPGMMM